jgi:peroxiredoxin
MRPRVALASFILTALVLTAVGRGVVAEGKKGAEIGKKAPTWKDLMGTDDKKHSLDDLKAAKAVLVVFMSNHCPVANAYEKRLVQFVKAYKSKGVELVAINVSNLDDDKLDKMKKRVKEEKLDFTYVYDPSQKVGFEYGATVTPHCFILDADRNVSYMGAFDDSQDEPKVKKQFVKDAVEAILAGKKPPVAVTEQFGCAIPYEKK